MQKQLCSLALGIVILLISACGSSVAPAAAPAAQTPIRIGWQTTWATQGQIVQALDKTNVLEKN
ncbi:MAG: hypothetical protein MI924_27805, partial [Chloroflexales bacterium]|nr:hypothetical protein [Chloroflexales bacterium]